MANSARQMRPAPCDSWNLRGRPKGYQDHCVWRKAYAVTLSVRLLPQLTSGHQAYFDPASESRNERAQRLTKAVKAAEAENGDAANGHAVNGHAKNAPVSLPS
jgi:hypothetical protein